MSELRTEGEIIAGRYRVVRPVGRGAFAVTYQVIELATGRHAALKETPLGGEPDRRTRAGLEHEARVLRSLHHPGIPRHVDSFEHQGTAGTSFFLVQGLARGETLWESPRRGQRFREAELAVLAEALLPILDYLHHRELPLVHRDIKPGNIVRSPSGQVTLVDFGAAQECGRDEPTILSDGTRGYMAPEQIRGRAVPASDLYGLGATLIFLATRIEPAELPTRGLRLQFRDHARVSRGFAGWLECLVEPQVSQRIPTAAAALARLYQTAARGAHSRRRMVQAMALAALAVGGLATRAWQPADNATDSASSADRCHEETPHRSTGRTGRGSAISHAYRRAPAPVAENRPASLGPGCAGRHPQ